MRSSLTAPSALGHHLTGAHTHRDESTLGVFAATLNSGHTLVILQHVARLTHAALLAGGGGCGASALTEAVWVRAGRQAGGKAGGVMAVGWALYSYGGETVVLAGRDRGAQRHRCCRNLTGMNDQHNLCFHFFAFLSFLLLVTQQSFTEHGLGTSPKERTKECIFQVNVGT